MKALTSKEIFEALNGREQKDRVQKLLKELDVSVVRHGDHAVFSAVCFDPAGKVISTWTSYMVVGELEPHAIERLARESALDQALAYYTRQVAAEQLAREFIVTYPIAVIGTPVPASAPAGVVSSNQASHLGGGVGTSGPRC